MDLGHIEIDFTTLEKMQSNESRDDVGDTIDHRTENSSKLMICSRHLETQAPVMPNTNKPSRSVLSMPHASGYV